MTFRTEFLKNRYLEQSTAIAYNKDRIYNIKNVNDKFSAGSLMFALNVNTWCCSQTCPSLYILCPGVCYPACCFAPVSIATGYGGYISCYCNPVTACCFCCDCCQITSVMPLNTDTCWTPLAKMVGWDAGLVMRVN